MTSLGLTILPIEVSSLEPVAGAGLAVSLAYLALDRFRYRSSIEHVASAILFKLLNGEWKGAEFEHLNDLKWLCRQNCNGHTPRGLGAFIYKFLFRKQTDTWIIAFLGTIAGFTLATGVALSIGRWGFAAGLNNSVATGVLFYACLLSITFPAAMVICGRRNVEWGHKFARHCETELLNITRQSARTVSAPPEVQRGGMTELDPNVAGPPASPTKKIVVRTLRRPTGRPPSTRDDGY